MLKIKFDESTLKMLAGGLLAGSLAYAGVRMESKSIEREKQEKAAKEAEKLLKKREFETHKSIILAGRDIWREVDNASYGNEKLSEAERVTARRYLGKLAQSVDNCSYTDSFDTALKTFDRVLDIFTTESKEYISSLLAYQMSVMENEQKKADEDRRLKAEKAQNEELIKAIKDIEKTRAAAEQHRYDEIAKSVRDVATYALKSASTNAADAATKALVNSVNKK